ncbi:MAG: RNA polymerase sigma factor [Sphingobium sp.]
MRHALNAAREIEAAYRADWARLLALLARRFDDLDLAEDALADAFASAARAWGVGGVPERPSAWLMRAAIRKAIDRLRRRATASDARRRLVIDAEDGCMDTVDPDTLPDERLALIFTCCHPALAREAQVALTLRLVVGLATPEIARLFLVAEPSMAARLTRAKRKIAAARIPFREPEPAERAERRDGVLAVIYLLFTEGYAGSAGIALIRTALAEEAIRLGRLLHMLIPGDGEVAALLALMLFQHARRFARVDGDGALVLLKNQDRNLWRHDEIAAADTLIAAPAADGPYRLQALIAASHCGTEGSNWPAIAAHYARLEALTGSPVVRLNRAVAVAEAVHPAAGLALLEGLDDRLGDHARLALVRGELLARTGRTEDAIAALRQAAIRTANTVERRHIDARIAALRD